MITALAAFYAGFTALVVLAIPWVAERIDVRWDPIGPSLRGFMVPAIVHTDATDWDDLEGLI